MRAEATREAVAADNKFSLTDLLPIPFQRRPKLLFNVITEMSDEGRKRRVPSTAEPMYYHSMPPTQGKFGPLLQLSGERPPTAEEIEAAMKKALAENGYLPYSEAHPRPEVLIMFEFGSNGVAEGLHSGTVGAEEVLELMLKGDPLDRPPGIAQIMIDRTRFIAGDKIAAELADALRQEIINLGVPGARSHPAPGSPFQLFMMSHMGDQVPHLVNTAFMPAYVATATAYDFEGAAQRKKIPLWQTRMVIDARGVTMDEVLRPLILNTGAYIGRETEAVTVQKRINREGFVEIGTAEVVREPAAAESVSNPAEAGKR